MLHKNRIATAIVIAAERTIERDVHGTWLVWATLGTAAAIVSIIIGIGTLLGG